LGHIDNRWMHSLTRREALLSLAGMLAGSTRWEDRDGSLWIGTAKGLVKSRGGRFETYTTRDGLANEGVTTLFEDAEGSLWIGTSGGGVTKLTERSFSTLSAG